MYSFDASSRATEPDTEPNGGTRYPSGYTRFDLAPRPLPAPERSHRPPTRRERLDRQFAESFDSVLAAQNRLLARHLGLVAR